MLNKTLPFFLFLSLYLLPAMSQVVLPEISVTNYSGRILVSWINDGTLPVKDILIQRSYDSLKNFTSIGTVLNPGNRENGYTDPNPPYQKMYYRVSLLYEGGQYSFSRTARPVKPPADSLIEEAPAPTIRYSWQLAEKKETDHPAPAPPGKFPIKNKPPVTPVSPLPEIKKPEPAYPSQWVYTAKESQIILNITDAGTRNFRIVFFNDQQQKEFELKKIPSDYLILDKSNFKHSGWYHFELYDGNELIEKNRFYVPRDGKQPDSLYRRSKNG